MSTEPFSIAIRLLAVVGALCLIISACIIAIALFCGYRAHQVRRPYRDEHQGA